MLHRLLLVWIIIVIPKLSVWTQHPISWIDHSFTIQWPSYLENISNERVKLAPSSGKQWYFEKKSSWIENLISIRSLCWKNVHPTAHSHCNCSSGKTLSGFRYESTEKLKCNGRLLQYLNVLWESKMSKLSYSLMWLINNNTKQYTHTQKDRMKHT